MERLYTRRFTNFNPLPRKEGDSPEDKKQVDDAIISIHSLVKRETAVGISIGTYQNYISIHSLVKRETAFSYAIIL